MIRHGISEEILLEPSSVALMFFLCYSSLCISSMEVNNCCKNILVLIMIVHRDKGEAANQGQIKNKIDI